MADESMASGEKVSSAPGTSFNKRYQSTGLHVSIEIFNSISRR
jgi:hypothetical protein